MNWNLEFVSPERLWVLLLLPLLVLGYVLLLRRRNRSGMRFTNTTLLSRVVPKQSQWRRHLAVGLSLASLLALTVAWARPQGIEMVPRERATIVMVIDVSRSMAAQDVSPTRLDAAKAAAIEFVDAAPESFNIAVVSLSGRPAVMLPPTTDRAQARQAINGLKPADSTAIGESIYTALSAFQLAPKGEDGSVAPGSIVLLSDGTNTAGRSPIQAATEAGDVKVPIYTIAYGTENGWVDLDGKRERVPPDPDQLRDVADASGGTSFTADSLDQLSDAYTSIRSQVGYQPVLKEITALWAGYGLAFAVVAALAAVSLGARWP